MSPLRRRDILTGMLRRLGFCCTLAAYLIFVCIFCGVWGASCVPGSSPPMSLNHDWSASHYLRDSRPARRGARTVARIRALMRLRGGGKEGGVTGLVNMGNTCYFNSVMQAMVHSSPLRREVERQGDTLGQEGDGQVTHKLVEFLRQMWDDKKARSTVLPSGLLSALCSVDSRFRGYEQQDSHELFQALLDAAGSEELKKRRMEAGQGEAHGRSLGGSEPEPFPCSVFAGRTVSVVTCGECGKMSNVTERFVDLSLQIPAMHLTKPVETQSPASSWGGWGSRPKRDGGVSSFSGGTGGKGESDDDDDDDDSMSPVGGVRSAEGGAQQGQKCTVEECLENFVQVEELVSHDGRPVWKCPSCARTGGERRVSASKKVRISRLPEVLVLHIKRFEMRGEGRVRKACVPVQMPPVLDMSRYAVQGEAGTYELCGVVNHVGSMEFGHYTAFVRQSRTGPNQWAYVSDTDVRDASEKEAMGVASSETAYLMFYTRVEVSSEDS